MQAWYVQIYGGPDDDPLDPDAFAPPDGGFWLGHQDGEPVAMGGWSRSAPSVGTIRRMYVAPRARRSGVAGQVLALIEADARGSGVARLILTTGSPQREAIAFYRAHGYTDVPSYGFYAGEPGAVHLGKQV